MTGMLDRTVYICSWICYAISAVLVFVMMSIIMIEVASRFFFNTSFGLSFVLSQQILVLLSFLGVSFIQIEDRHLKVTVLTSRLGKQAKNILQTIVTIMVMGLSFVVCLSIWETAFMSLKLGLLSTGTPALPLAPHELLVCLGNFLLFWVCVVATIKNIRGFRRRVRLPFIH